MPPMTSCDGFIGFCVSPTVPDNVYLLVAFIFLSVVMAIRLVRWVLDILP